MIRRPAEAKKSGRRLAPSFLPEHDRPFFFFSFSFLSRGDRPDWWVVGRKKMRKRWRDFWRRDVVHREGLSVNFFCKCESQDGIFVVRCLVLTGGDSVRKKPKTSSQGGICGERFIFLYVSEFSSQK